MLKKSKKTQLLKKEMPTLSIQKGKYHISYLNMIFNHSSVAAYNLEMYFKIEPCGENSSVVDNSIFGEFVLKLHADIQGLIDLVEPLIREDIGIASTTNTKINFIKVYLKYIERDLFTISMSYRTECSTTGCATQEHSNDISYTPEVFTKVNQILKDTGFRLNLDIENMTDDEVSSVGSRSEILDL